MNLWYPAVVKRLKGQPVMANGKKVGEVIEARQDEHGLSYTMRIDDWETYERLLGTTEAPGRDRTVPGAS